MTTPEVSAIRDADRVVGKLREREIPLQLIINRVRPEMVKAGEMMSIEDVGEILGADILGVIPDDEGVIDTTNRGEPLVLDETQKLAAIYGRIARRLEGEDLPLTDLDPPSVFSKFFTMWKAG